MKQIEQTLTSVEVAEMVGKKHKNLIRDIREYAQELGELKIEPTDFFKESVYHSAQGKTLPCYKITKKGCEFVAHKLTGVKGTEFTAKYIDRFHEMQDAIKQGEIGTPDRASIMLMNARSRMANMYLKLANVDTLSPTYKSVLVSKAGEVLAGEEIIPLPKPVQLKTYSASELGKKLGVSAQMVGRLSNKHGLKTEEYGEWQRSKSQYSSKECDTFVYYDSAIAKFKEII